MLVRRVIEWISPPNKLGTSVQNSEESVEEVAIGDQNLKMEENIDGDSLRRFVHKKNEEKTFLELIDTDVSPVQTVGAGGDCGTDIPTKPKLSPLCMRILQKPEDRRTKRNVFTQTDYNKHRGKVSFNAYVTKHSSSESRIDQKNRLDDGKHSINSKNSNILTRSCENLKESFGCDLEEKINNDFDDRKGFLLQVKKALPIISEDGIIQTRVATLLRDAVKECHHKELDSNLYGELLVLGGEDDTSRLSSRFILRKRQKASGVKEVSSDTYLQPLPICKHTVSFQVSASRSVVVEYARDIATDMFQMGRHEYPPIDIRVANVNNGRKGVSRFACRLVVQRHGYPRQVRLYAAAFDASGNIFLGEEAVAGVYSGGDMDGFTTNGVHLLHPGREWMEVSVRGRLYQARAPGESAASRHPLQEEDNLLLDGTLIDLCGVTLMWRTREGLMVAPDEDCLDRMDCLLKESAAQCQRRNGPLTGELHYCGEDERRAFVFLSCGHVVSMAVRLKGTMEGWSCPECRVIGSVACLRIGREPGFYADKDLPSHVFRPCGHVATLRTVKYWATVAMPPHRNAQEKGVCPFCATKLHPIHKYVELIYPTQ